MFLKVISVILLCVSGPVLTQECGEIISCLLDVEEAVNIQPTAELCDVENFVITISLDQCIPDPASCDSLDVLQAKDGILALYDSKCATYVAPTTTASPPADVDCSDAGLQDFVIAQQNCISLYDELDELQLNLILTKHAVCSSIQAKINCLNEVPQVQQCPSIAQEANRRLVADIRFAHLFGCDVQIQGKTVAPPNDGCKFWEWLSCHDTLFVALQLGTVDVGFNLGQLVDLINTADPADISIINEVVTGNGRSCSDFDNVDWAGIASCRAALSASCSVLYRPPSVSDSLWAGVGRLIAQFTVQVINPLTDLLDLQAICSQNCADILTRYGTLIGCLPTDSVLVPTIINKQNQQEPYATECETLGMALSCVRDAAEPCTHLVRLGGQLLNFYSTSGSWQAAIELCGDSTSMIKAEPGEACFGSGGAVTDGKIRSECSGRYSGWRDIILDEDKSAMDMCNALQAVSTCYWRNIKDCSNFERGYWSGETSLMMAANQMLDCSIHIGNFEIVSTSSGCDWTGWVGCTSGLWQALGVSVPASDRLPVEGFKRLLKLVWEDWDKAAKDTMCYAVRNLDFVSINTCIQELSMECTFPRVTVPDGETYPLLIKDPFDLVDIKSVVDVVCTKDCGDNLGGSLQTCLQENRLHLYPLDILYGDYVNSYNTSKCRRLTYDVQCVETTVSERCNQLTMARDLASSPAIEQAQAVCKRCCKTTAPPTTTGQESIKASSILVSVLAVAVSQYVAGMSGLSP